MTDLDTKMIQHIIWDWNGTLLDDLALCVSIINPMLRKRGLNPISKDQYLEVFDFPVKDYYQFLGFDFLKEPFEEVSTEFITAYESGRPGCKLMEDAAETLDTFQKWGFSQSIISASKIDYLKKAVGEYGIKDYFEYILGLDNHHAAGKLALGRTYLSSSGVDPKTVALIGDTIHDAELAEVLGFQCVLIPSGHQSRARLETTQATIKASLADLKNIFTRPTF